MNSFPLLALLSRALPCALFSAAPISFLPASSAGHGPLSPTFFLVSALCVCTGRFCVQACVEACSHARGTQYHQHVTELSVNGRLGNRATLVWAQMCQSEQDACERFSVHVCPRVRPLFFFSPLSSVWAGSADDKAQPY
eukprot:m.140780 g.140780  ORF g.140780 m.140780 type:complete len:139 (-) comp10017_c2_seq1:292-708(-)